MVILLPAGTCVTFGVSEGPKATFDSGVFFRSGGVRRLAGVLKPRIEIESDWAEIGAVARQLLERSFVGKAVLHVE